MIATGHGPRFNVQALRDQHPIADVIGKHVELKRAGGEFQGLCPFHSERSPSFTVNAEKQFAHCFGCGWHGDVIDYLMRLNVFSFVEACEALSGGVQFAKPAVPAKQTRMNAPRTWVALVPVPEGAPPLLDSHGCAEVTNPKRGRVWRVKPARVDAYHDVTGRLLGYVIRVDFADGKKIAAQVTWCVAADGTTAWSLRPFPSPRPLQGLDALALRTGAPVLIVEGEKCRQVAALAFPQYVVMTWPGGSNGIRKVDWSPLRGRTVVLWPDADEAGRQAMLGYRHFNGLPIDGVAQRLARIGVGPMRLVDPQGQPQGWDVADALEVDGWTAQQVAVWARSRITDLEVEFTPVARVA